MIKGGVAAIPVWSNTREPVSPSASSNQFTYFFSNDSSRMQPLGAIYVIIDSMPVRSTMAMTGCITIQLSSIVKYRIPWRVKWRHLLKNKVRYVRIISLKFAEVY